MAKRKKKREEDRMGRKELGRELRRFKEQGKFYDQPLTLTVVLGSCDSSR